VRWSDVDVSGISGWDTYGRFVEMAKPSCFARRLSLCEPLWDRLDVWLPRAVLPHFFPADEIMCSSRDSI